jgi:hypothetical protein
MEKLTEAQRQAFLESMSQVAHHAAAAAAGVYKPPPGLGATGHHRPTHHGYSSKPEDQMSEHLPPSHLKVPILDQYKPSTDPTGTFVLPDDTGLGFEDGIRVLRALGSW